MGYVKSRRDAGCAFWGCAIELVTKQEGVYVHSHDFNLAIPVNDYIYFDRDLS